MNTISLFSCEIVNYSAEKQQGVVTGKNDYGTYLLFRLKEAYYKNINYWMCFCGDENLVKRICNMKLEAGDIVNVIGSVECYNDKAKQKTSYRIVISGIDYAVKKHPSKKNNEAEGPKEDLPRPTAPVSIDLDDQNLFVSKLNFE